MIKRESKKRRLNLGWLAVAMMAVMFAIPLVTHAQVDNLALNPSFEENEVILNDPGWYQWATWG